jgi:hypothetical protein
MIQFTTRPNHAHAAAKWQPTNMVVNGIRVWATPSPSGPFNLHRVGRYGTKFFNSWSVDREPNYI